MLKKLKIDKLHTGSIFIDADRVFILLAYISEHRVWAYYVCNVNESDFIYNPDLVETFVQSAYNKAILEPVNDGRVKKVFIGAFVQTFTNIKETSSKKLQTWYLKSKMLDKSLPDMNDYMEHIVKKQAQGYKTNLDQLDFGRVYTTKTKRNYYIVLDCLNKSKKNYYLFFTIDKDLLQLIQENRMNTVRKMLKDPSNSEKYNIFAFTRDFELYPLDVKIENYKKLFEHYMWWL